MAGYPIASLKKAEEISGQDIFPVQQNGITKQIERSILDQAVIVSESGPQSSGIIRKEGVFVLKNDAQIIFTLENAAGRIVENNEYVDSAEAASGWMIYVVNTSEIQHIVIHSQNSWPIPAGETLVFFWTGSHFTLHNIVINNLTVRGDTKLLEVLAVQTLVAENKLAVIGADGKIISTTANDIVGLANVDGKIDAKLVDYQTKLTFNGTPSATNKVVTDSALNNALTDYMKIPLLSVNITTSAYLENNLKCYSIGNVVKFVGSFKAKTMASWGSSLGIFPYAPSENIYVKDKNGNNIFFIRTDKQILLAKNLTENEVYFFDFTMEFEDAYSIVNNALANYEERISGVVASNKNVEIPINKSYSSWVIGGFAQGSGSFSDFLNLGTNNITKTYGYVTFSYVASDKKITISSTSVSGSMYTLLYLNGI